MRRQLGGRTRAGSIWVTSAARHDLRQKTIPIAADLSYAVPFLGRYAAPNENFVLVWSSITAVLSVEFRVLSEGGNGFIQDSPLITVYLPAPSREFKDIHSSGRSAPAVEI